MALLPFGSPPPIKEHGLLLGLTDDDHTQYALLAGRSGGQTLIGGTTSADFLTLQAYTGTYDNEAAGRIEIKSPLVWNDNVAVNASLAGFFNLGTLKLWDISGTFTLENGMNAGGVNVVSAGYTLQYSNSQAVTAAPVFVGGNVIQPTTNVTDGSAVLWSDFQAGSIFRPNLATALTAITQNFIGFIALPQVQIQSGSHAGALAFVTNLTGFDVFSNLLPAVSSQSGAGNAVGLVVHNPTKSGTGILHQVIGIDIESLTAGSDANFAIRTGASGRVSFGAAVETPTIRLKDSNGTQWDFVTDTSGNLDTTGTEVAFDPMVNMSWYALYMASRLSFADGADVTLWEDASGNFRHLNQGNAADVPIMETSSTDLNSQKAVEFTSANSQALVSRLTVAMTAAAGISIVAVVSFKTLSAVMKILGHTTANNNRGFGTTATPNWQTQMGATANAAGTPATATKYFVRIYATSTAHTLFVNEVSTATTATAAQNLNQIVVGAGRNASNTFAGFLDGYIGLLGFYTGDISADTQWTRFKTYLNSTYGFAL